MSQKTYLQEIDLGHNDLSSVHPDVLAQGVNMIQVVKLYDTSLTRYGCYVTWIRFQQMISFSDNK